MMELGRLYQEVAELVHQQEPAVEQINQDANNVQENVANANTQISSAIDSARRARKWKWYALIIISKFGRLPYSHHMLTVLPSHHHCHCRRCCGWCDPGKQVNSASRRTPLPMLFHAITSRESRRTLISPAQTRT